MATKQLSNPITIRINSKSISLSPGSFSAESIAKALQDKINHDNTSPVVISFKNGIISITPVYIGNSQTLFFSSINDANFLGWNSTMVTLPSIATFPFIGDRPALSPPLPSPEPSLSASPEPSLSASPEPSPQPYDINKNLSDLKYFTSLGLNPEYNESFKNALNEYKLNNGVDYNPNISQNKEEPSNNSQNKKNNSLNKKNNSQNKKNNSLNKKNNSQNKKNNSLNKKTKGGLSKKSTRKYVLN